MESKSVFVEMFCNNPVAKVLDFLIIHDEFDYSMTDIAEFSGVGYSTLKLFWPNLESKGVVTCVRTVGKAKMFKLNYKNLSIEKLKIFYWSLAKQAIRNELNKVRVSA